MDIETLYGYRIYIIESLPLDRLHTGINLMHKLQELWTKKDSSLLKASQNSDEP